MSFKIGFTAGTEENKVADEVIPAASRTTQVKKSLVRVYFAERNLTCTYYNDMFDLSVGDIVYVDGKLEGIRGRVVEVSYSFKIKLSDYKKVIAVIDTNVKVDFYLAGSHVVSFDRNAIPFSKVLTWFKTPENDEDYVSGNDDTNRFPLDDLSKMKISHDAADRGHDYYIENRVGFVEVDGTRGHAIVEGSENYEIEFDYIDSEISNLKCSCFCSGDCKHEFAAMLQLKESLELITENYEDEYNGYFAIISKGAFMNTVMIKKVSGKIRF